MWPLSLMVTYLLTYPLGFPSGGLFVSEAAKDFLLATFTSIGTTEVQEMVEQFDKQIISAESNLVMISNGSTGFPITRQAGHYPAFVQFRCRHI